VQGCRHVASGLRDLFRFARIVLSVSLEFPLLP
jgi:hypothetical protein